MIILEAYEWIKIDHFMPLVNILHSHFFRIYKTNQIWKQNKFPKWIDKNAFILSALIKSDKILNLPLLTLQSFFKSCTLTQPVDKWFLKFYSLKISVIWKYSNLYRWQSRKYWPLEKTGGLYCIHFYRNFKICSRIH